MQRRKDNKGRVLKDGEVYRKSDGLYMYRWTAKNGKRHTIYDATLEGLREKEEKPARLGRWHPHSGVQLDPE